MFFFGGDRRRKDFSFQVFFLQEVYYRVIVNVDVGWVLNVVNLLIKHVFLYLVEKRVKRLLHCADTDLGISL